MTEQRHTDTCKLVSEPRENRRNEEQWVGGIHIYSLSSICPQAKRCDYTQLISEQHLTRHFQYVVCSREYVGKIQDQGKKK